MFSLAKSTLPYFFKYPQSRVLSMTQAYAGKHSLRRAIFFITSSKESSSDSLFHKAFSYSSKREYSHTEAKHKVQMRNRNAITIISLVYICVKHIPPQHQVNRHTTIALFPARPPRRNLSHASTSVSPKVRSLYSTSHQCCLICADILIT